MSKPVVEPVSGPDLCPECQGARVLTWDRMMGYKKKFNLQEIYGAYQNTFNVLRGEDGTVWVWCPQCGGSGTATDAMTRLMMGVPGQIHVLP